MAEHLRDALRDFALQKMRDLEAERAKKSKKDDDNGSNTQKPSKIKINRSASKLISGSSKKADGTETVQSESAKSLKRHQDESDAGESSKMKKLMKLYEEDASEAIRKDGSGSVNSPLESKKTTDEPAKDKPSAKEQDGRTVKSSGWTKIVKEEPTKGELQFKGLLSSKKVESDGEVAAEKKSAPTSGEKKMIKINIQTKLLQLPKGLETATKNGSGSDSESSSDDDSDDSDDENQAADGLPWRTILEDGELTPSSDEEEEKPEEHDVQENGGDVEKSIEEKEKEVTEEKGDNKAKKKSSKHKHKSKHKKHKPKKDKKKKSKHKKDKKEKDSTSDVKNDKSSTSKQKTREGKDSKVSGIESTDMKHKGDKTSSSRRKSKDEKKEESKQKEEVAEDRKGRRSSSSSRRTSEEREGRKSREEKKVTKGDSVNDEKTINEERKDKSRSHCKSRSSSKEKSQVKDVKEDKKREGGEEKLVKGSDPVNKEEKKRSNKDEKHGGSSRSSEKVSHRESSKKSKKTEEDDEHVFSSEVKLGGGARHHKEECKRDIECDDRGSGATLLLEKEKAAKTDAREESRTIRESPKSTSAVKRFTVTISDDSTSETHMDSKSDDSHTREKHSSGERLMKEDKEQKEDSRKRDRREEKKDNTEKKSRHEESRREKRHKEKGKDKEDKKRHHSKKHHTSTKVKIDHLEHDFPSAEEYAEDAGIKTQSEKSEKKDDVKADVKSQISISDQGKTPEIQAAPVDPTEAAVSLLDDAPAKSAVSGKEMLKEESVPAESKKSPTDLASAAAVSDPSSNPSHAETPEETQKMSGGPGDTDVASAEQIEPISEVKDSITATKNLESSSTKADVTKMGTETSDGVNNSKAVENKGTKHAKSPDSTLGKTVAAGEKEDLTSSEQKEEGALSTASSTDQPVKTSKSSEKNVESKAAQKATDKESKKKKKDKSDDKEEGAIDSEIEEGEIVKKHKKSKKKDKKKDKSEKDRKDRSERDRSEHRDKKHKRRHSDSRSDSRSRSQSRKRHKGSRSRSRSDDDGDSDISIGKTKMIEKSYFSESRGCWVTRMVPKEDDSSSSGNDDGNEPYDIGDTYIRHPPHDRRSVFDRLGGGSSGRSSRGRYNDRYDRHSRYGYSRRRGRSYSRSRSRSPEFQIDKKKLLEIAKANALQRMRAGELPPNLPIPESMKKAADSFEVNESIQKFTDRCKALANLQGGSSDDDSPVNKPVGSDDEDEDGNDGEKPFVRHPFKVKEAAPIVMNIKNAVQIPVASKDKLRVQFPVSSGSQHRKKEEEIIIASANDPYGQWTAVEKPEPKPPPPPAAAAAPTTKASTTQPPATPATTPATQTTPAATVATTPAATTTPAAPAASAAAPAVAGPHIPGVTNVQPPQPVPKEDKVFEDTPGFSYDIGQIVSARLKAARALQSNPNNVEALTVLHHSQKQIQTWAHSSKKPGLFTGSTDATFLRPEELGNPNRKNQAWIKKDMFLTAAPVSTDIGRSLMHKMGWKQGEGLGKNKEGALNPLLLEIKTDRQGLVAAEEKPKKKGDVSKVIRKDLSGKHPVMALNELCNKRRWGKPTFETVREDGPPHKKNFVFKVKIRNEEYIPTVPSGNKKDAKAMAATVALQRMGLLPS